MVWQTISLVSLVLIGLWAYGFNKIGVAFMPPLDEGTMLDMPVTVPRIGITQAADDLKARDALLRGFPEVESVIGKSGRADTPTDPAPLDMVETFVNFRPKELWPKRVLKFNDARRHVDDVLETLEREGYVPEMAKDDLENLANDAAQKALERFDETQRELALLRYQEFEGELESELVRFAVRNAVERLEARGAVSWPVGYPPERRREAMAELAKALAPEFGRWIAKNPALEDIDQIARRIAERLKAVGAIDDVAEALKAETGGPTTSSGWFRSLVSRFRQMADEVRGRESFESELLEAVESERMRLWRERVQRSELGTV